MSRGQKYLGGGVTQKIWLLFVGTKSFLAFQPAFLGQ